MRTIKQTCVPRPGTFDSARRDTVLDLTDLIENRIEPDVFFAENYITEGMKTLLTEGFRRLEGKSDQDVFKLTQAMGGGKTHNLLALGLLAKHPEYRTSVMGGFYSPDSTLGSTRMVAFTGRESDAPLGIWGAIADQLGKKEQFADYSEVEHQLDSMLKLDDREDPNFSDAGYQLAAFAAALRVLTKYRSGVYQEFARIQSQ